MKFKTFRRAAYARVAVEGRIEPHHMNAVRESVAKLVDEGFHDLVLDLTEASSELPPRVLASLAQLFAVVRMADGVIVVVKPGLGFLDYLDRMGLEPHVTAVDAADEALPALLARAPKRYDQTFFRLLLDRSVLSKAALKDALETWRASGERQPFGDILMERHGVSIEQLLDVLAQAAHPAPHQVAPEVPPEAPPEPPQDLAEAVEALAELTPPEPPPAPRAEVATPGLNASSEFVRPSLLGTILVEHKLITREQLRDALDVQRSRPGSKLGDVLLELGFLTNAGIFDALQSQCRRRGDDAPTAADPSGTFVRKPTPKRSEFVRASLLGEILLELNLINEEQLRRALELRRQDPKSRQLGDILVEMGAVTPSQLLEALGEQAKRKNR